MGKKSKNKDKTKCKEQEPLAKSSSESRSTSLPSHNNGTPLTLAPFPITNTGTTPPLIQALQCGTGCTHGAKAADLGSIPYISTFCEEFCLDCPEYLHLKMVDAMERDGLNNIPPDTIKAMYAIGTNLLLSRQEELFSMAGVIAMFIAALGSGPLSDMAASGHAIHNHNNTVDSPKKLLAFYYKGITCHCLDKPRKLWKADISRSLCQNCIELFPDNQIYDCSQCHLAKYCSKKCQREHWPQHKLECNYFHMTRKNQQTTTP